MIVNILTIIAAIYAFFKLFMKDRQQEKQISSIASLVKSQEDQLSEFRKQNEIFQSQLEVTQKYFETDISMKKSKFNGEKIKRMKEIRPYFIRRDSNNFGYRMLNLTIKNKGQTANEIVITFLNCINIKFHNINTKMDKVVNGFEFVLKGTIKSENPFEYTIRIEFLDDEKNQYFQILNGNTIHVREEEPILISEKENINV